MPLIRLGTIAAIDPGFDGAVAFLDEHGRLFGLQDTPTFTVTGGAKKKRTMDLRGMIDILRDYVPVKVAIEDVHSMPGQGVAGAFAFGRGFGAWEGILAALSIPVVKVSPQKWKKAMLDGMGKEKDASRVRASELFPAAELGLKKHHGRADALLIALWLWQQERGK